MAYRDRRRDSGSRGTGSPARRAAGTGLILSVVLFLLPLLTVPSPGSGETAEELPTGTLPIHRAVQTASGERDKSRMVKLQQADGTVAELSMSDYLFGVVAAEMPAAFEEEALKAQACAARTYTVPVTDTHTRTEVLTEGRVVQKAQRHVLFEYESGRTAVYDFMSDQYHSLIRPRTLRLRGTRGELDDWEVHYLNEANLPETARIEVTRDPATGEALRVTFRGETLYTPPFGRCGLPEDETAIAQMLEGMARYIETGVEVYPMADALEDAYTALLMESPAVTPGAGLDGGAAAPLAGGWYQRQSGPRPWKEG